MEKLKHLVRVITCFSVGAQLTTACLPGFSHILTHTERSVHHLVTLSVVALLLIIHKSHAHIFLRLLLLSFTLLLVSVEQVSVGTKTFLPLLSERLFFVLTLPVILLALAFGRSMLLLARRGVFCVYHSLHVPAYSGRGGTFNYRRR